MRFLVTGASGQLGSEVVNALDGQDVVAPTSASVDLVDPGAVSTIVVDSQPDAIINCAAFTSVDGCEQDADTAHVVNGEAPGALAEAAGEVGAHLVQVSTDYVFRGDKSAPYLEHDEPDPQSVYGRTKLAGERAVAAADGSWTIVRTAWVFGRRGRSFPEWVLESARAGRDIPAVSDHRGSPTSALDLAPILIEAAERRTPGIAHVVNAGACTWYELAREVLTLAGLDPARVTSTTWSALDRPAPRPANSVLGTLGTSGLPTLRHYRDALAELIGRPDTGEVHGGEAANQLPEVEEFP